MVAEILAGIALAKSAVTGIKSMIDTANDVGDIAHHIDNLFKSRDQVKRDIHKNQNAKKPKSKIPFTYTKILTIPLVLKYLIFLPNHYKECPSLQHLHLVQPGLGS